MFKKINAFFILINLLWLSIGIQISYHLNFNQHHSLESIASISFDAEEDDIPAKNSINEEKCSSIDVSDELNFFHYYQVTTNELLNSLIHKVHIVSLISFHGELLVPPPNFS